MTALPAHDADGDPSEHTEVAVAPLRVDRAEFAREFPSGDATATECAHNLVRTAGIFFDADTRALRRHGLSTAARILLATLEGAHEPLSQTALAQRLIITGASVSSLVDTLERKGLVRRVPHPTDRRVALVELTEAATPVLDGYLAEVTALHTQEFAGLSADERETLVMLLARVAAAIESLDVDAVVAAARPRKRPRSSRGR